MSHNMLENKVAVITGASSGIGASTAVLFAKMGATLTLTGRNMENLEKTNSKCMNYGKAQVNCAGILESGNIESTSLDQYDRVMNTNVKSVYHLTMLCVPHLIKTKGSIVNVSSVNGIRSFPNVLAYCMSKAAIDQMTKCVALELAGKGVRVNAVNPGLIKTEVHRRGGMDEKAYQEFLAKSKTTHALGRAGEPEEVAEVIAFLASSAASFITGATLPVDGGRHAMCPR